jgi:uncharacterized protein (TIGR02145 family)
MKKLYPLIALLLLCANINAQPPQKISYQAVVRDNQEQIVANKIIGVQISILQNSTEIYKETHQPQTNANGLFSLEIGGGNAVLGNFSTIDWSIGKHFVETKIDLNGGTNYTLSSTTELSSVPYAFHAQTAERLTINPQETDPIFSASVAKNITQTDIENWNKKQQQYVLHAGENITISNDTIHATIPNTPDLSNFLVLSDLNDLIDTINTKQNTLHAGENITITNDTIHAIVADLSDFLVLSDLNDLLEKFEQLENKIKQLEIDLQIANGTLVKDIDGNIYKAQKYGNQTWMIENLRVTKYNDGTPLNYVQDSLEWANSHAPFGYYLGLYTSLTPPQYCFVDTSDMGKVKYGALYSWFTANPTNNKQLCPAGWRVPSLNDWEILRDWLIANDYNYDGTTTGNKVAISMATGDWIHNGVVGTPGDINFSEKKNASNFSIFPNRLRDFNGNFGHPNSLSRFWSTNSGNYFGAFMGRYMSISSSRESLFICPNGTAAYFAESVRCIKN